MQLNLKQIGWLTLATQSALVVWMNIRNVLDPFSQLVLIPLVMVTGMALLSLQQRDKSGRD